MPQNTTTGIPGRLCTLDICAIEDSLYDYRPSLPLNALLLAVFAASFLAYSVQCSIYRTWTFLIAMGFGCIAEVIGYEGRIMSYKNPFKINPFLTQIICLTIAPAFLAAGIYLCLSRIVTIFGANLSRIAPRNYTRIFISCDFISLVLQGAGGGVASVKSQNNEDPALGNNIMIAGVAFQVFTLALFMTLCAEFAYRVWKSGQQLDMNYAILRNSRRFRGFLGALALSTICIQIRSIYRLIEMSQGWNGALIANQTLFFVLEGLMVAIAVVALNVFHPGMCLREAYHFRPLGSSKGKGDSTESCLPLELSEHKPHGSPGQ